jgi:hypothetical protein
MIPSQHIEVEKNQKNSIALRMLCQGFQSGDTQCERPNM